MWRATKLILLTAALLALAWRVYTLPGQVTARAGAYNVTTSVPAAVLLLFIAAIFLTILLRVAGGLWKAPVHLRAWRSTKRNETGDTALQRSLVAIAADRPRRAADVVGGAASRGQRKNGGGEPGQSAGLSRSR